MKKHHQKFYHDNNKYSDWLDSQENDVFKKYIYYVEKYLDNGKRSFLDIGCGTGTALKTLVNSDYKVRGIEISKSSVKLAKKKGILCKLYDGKKIPHKDSTFDVTGSFNVLEHTDNPLGFLDEQYRVTKKDGMLIIICPNFYSITNSYHHHTKGFVQKTRNLISLSSKLLFKSKPSFEKMDTVDRDYLYPDDDAVNATNPVDILNWSKEKNLTLLYWSAQQNFGTGLKYSLDIGFFKLLFGACFFVFKK